MKADMAYAKILLKKELSRDMDGKQIVTFQLLCEDMKLLKYLKKRIICGSMIIAQELNDYAAFSDYVEFYSLEHDVDSLNRCRTLKQNNWIQEEMPRKPILHWSMYDLFALSETPLKKIYYIPRYIKYLDSSIWHYFFSLFVWGEKVTRREVWLYNSDIKHLEYILNCIWENACNGRYNFANTHEYCELNTRLANNAYLDEKAHAQAVSPFVFHSEYEMEKELRKCLEPEEKRLAHNFCCNVKWRMLLVDDYANKPLKEADDISQSSDCCLKINGDENGGMAVKVTGKLKVIIDDLQSKGCTDIVWCCPSEVEINERYENRNNNQWELKPWNWYDINGDRVEKYTDPDIAIACATNVKHAFQLLILQRYDIVLLDYLLGDRKDKKGREYSYYLLKLIYDKCNPAGVGEWSLFTSLYIEDDGNVDKTDLLGPDGCLYFMHISAFVSAIQERLREQHLLRNESFWHIAHGACPTNTPELFLYYLYRIMKKRYESIMIQDGQEVGSLIHFLDGIYKENPRMQSVNKFNTLLNLRAQYNRIKNDVYKEERDLLNMKKGDPFINGCSPLDCRSSRLISSTFPDILFYGNSFWEHLQHLIYLTAYGTIRQWTEMWEEYSFIKPKLVLNGDKGKKVCKAIEDYIIALKSNS